MPDFNTVTVAKDAKESCIAPVSLRTARKKTQRYQQ
jgi:hypothetical protein